MAKNVIKVGDRVRFKQREQMLAEFGENGSSGFPDVKGGFTTNMKDMCGVEATVEFFYKDNNNFVGLKDFTKAPQHWWVFSTDMLEDASLPVYKQSVVKESKGNRVIKSNTKISNSAKKDDIDMEEWVEPKTFSDCVKMMKEASDMPLKERHNFARRLIKHIREKYPEKIDGELEQQIAIFETLDKLGDIFGLT